MKKRYDTAQICINGHIITDSIQVDPEDQKRCDKCGGVLFIECQNCGANIRGREYIPDLWSGSRPIQLHKAPQFCYQCGNPYPWLETKIQAARELAQELDNISDDEKEILVKSIDEIVIDTPKTEVAAIRLKKILSKSGQQVAEAFKNILVSVVSESVKKMIWPS